MEKDNPMSAMYFERLENPRTLQSIDFLEKSNKFSFNDIENNCDDFNVSFIYFGDRISLRKWSVGFFVRVRPRGDAANFREASSDHSAGRAKWQPFCTWPCARVISRSPSLEPPGCRRLCPDAFRTAEHDNSRQWPQKEPDLEKYRKERVGKSVSYGNRRIVALQW